MQAVESANVCLDRPGVGRTPPTLETTGAWPRVCLVGPLPPPSGGMANQCEQLVRLLGHEGVTIELVQTNRPVRPAWLGRVPILRAFARLLPYIAHLWRATGRAQVLHVLANSGWAWHLFAAPALWIAHLRARPVLVNYRGGGAAAFLARAPRIVHWSLRRADACVTPSDFLRRIFAGHDIEADVIPNVIDLGRFIPRAERDFGDAPHIVVARNLEPIYGLDTAIQALGLLRKCFPGVTMTIAGSGPQRGELIGLARQLGLGDAIAFPGRVNHADMPALYASADLALNPSTVDNMPNSVLEAFASMLPVVSTSAGGVPDILQDGVHGLLVPVGDAMAMAHAMKRLLDDRTLARSLSDAGRQRAEACAWDQVKRQWLAAYRQCVNQRGGAI